MKTLTYTLKTVLLTLLILMSSTLFAQHRAITSSFNGVWVGKIITADETQGGAIALEISNGTCKRLFYNSETKELESDQELKESTLMEGNHVIYTWMNKGGMWSESQVHQLAYLKKGVLHCVYYRQVNNAKADEDYPEEGINQEWSISLSGLLYWHKDRNDALAYYIKLEEEN